MTRWRMRRMPRMMTSSPGHGTFPPTSGGHGGQPPPHSLTSLLSSRVVELSEDDAMAHEKDAENDDFFSRARGPAPPPLPSSSPIVFYDLQT